MFVQFCEIDKQTRAFSYPAVCLNKITSPRTAISSNHQEKNHNIHFKVNRKSLPGMLVNKGNRYLAGRCYHKNTRNQFELKLSSDSIQSVMSLPTFTC